MAASSYSPLDPLLSPAQSNTSDGPHEKGDAVHIHVRRNSSAWNADEGPQSKHSRATRYSPGKLLAYTAIVLTVAGTSWYRGKHSIASDPVEFATLLSSGDVAKACNPYNHRGVLFVNSTSGPENRWQPISVSPECQPLDLITATMIQSLGTDEGAQKNAEVDLEFAKNKTILLLGDSVDRDHLIHFCQFVKGQHHWIGDNHVLSPRLPKGRETGPPNYVNPNDKSRNWSNFDQSRPHVCQVPHLNLVIINLFYYGFRDRDELDLWDWKHFYPPHLIEDRFDQIARPLLASVSEIYGSSPVPDLVSITPGLWDLMRIVFEDNALNRTLIAAGETDQAVLGPLNPWSDLSSERLDHMASRMTFFLKHVADAWPAMKDGRAIPHPKILWRTLHHIKKSEWLPFHRVQAIDQLGRRVVERLVEEGRAAIGGDLTWRTWLKDVSSLGDRHASKSKALTQGFGTRLEIDEWGALMLGQEKHFVDDAHPKALPGSWLYGQMMMTQLKIAMAERAQAP